MDTIDEQGGVVITKKHVSIQCYGSSNSIDIYRASDPQDGYEFQLYLKTAQTADTLMTREQMVKLRDALNEILEGK